MAVQIIRDLESCSRPDNGTAVTIGAYDGVHRGHRAVIAEMRRQATEGGFASAVITFDPHPARVVRPESAPLLLTSLDQKLELLDETGLDMAVVIPFDEQRSLEPAPDFVKSVLVDTLNTRLIVVGADFHFGHRRSGNVPLLEDMGAELGFGVVGHALVDVDGVAARDDAQVSSTAIRRALVDGAVQRASSMLGRPFELRGTVVEGDKRGRELGFPTANVAIDSSMLAPADGVYAAWYERPDGSIHASAVNYGRRPTFYDDAAASVLECHLLDFDADLYGEPARVRFIERLRPEQAFDGIDALKDQLQRDCAAAASALGR